jgi:hypothetical protein
VSSRIFRRAPVITSLSCYNHGFPRRTSDFWNGFPEGWTQVQMFRSYLLLPPKQCVMQPSSNIKDEEFGGFPLSLQASTGMLLNWVTTGCTRKLSNILGHPTVLRYRVRAAGSHGAEPFLRSGQFRSHSTPLNIYRNKAKSYPCSRPWRLICL